MHRPPFINFPFPFYRNYPRIGISFHTKPYSNTNYNINKPPNNFSDNKLENYEVKEENKSFNTKNKSNKYTDDYLFDLFGLKIYSDDVLLVSLIYFLYSEDVKDDGLFLVLILLLLS